MKYSKLKGIIQECYFESIQKEVSFMLEPGVDAKASIFSLILKEESYLLNL